jgi:rRNA maturation protein Nop10
MKESCPKCSTKTVMAKPPKYSPVDKYAEYRRTALHDERKKSGLI